MKRCAFALSLVVGLFPVPAVQATVWLTPHLDAQRFNNMRQGQLWGIDKRRKSARNKAVAPHKRQAKLRCSPDTMPAARKNLIEAEYYRRLARYGRPSANAWATEQAQKYRRELAAQGIC